MRWTLWLILLVLCGIYERLIDMTGASAMAVVSLCISGIALFMDYLSKRRE